MFHPHDQSFNFFPVPTDVHFGAGVSRALPEHIQRLGAKHVFVVTDPGIKAAGLLEKIEADLSEANLACTVFDTVKADSGSQLIDTCTAELKKCGADIVVGMGGGSSLDTAKAAAALATNPGCALEYVGFNTLKHRPLPMIAIPTTSGTGSEVTLWSVFTDESRDLKVAIGSFLNYPTMALCDPELTLGLPPQLTAATGMDALGHAIECFTNKACQPISAALALPAIEYLGRSLRTVVHEGSNLKARYEVMLASTMAGIAMNPTRLGLAHALAMPLGSWNLRVPHGLAVAITLPRVMEFNVSSAPERFATVARALGVNIEGLSQRDSARASSEAVQSISRDVGIPTGLEQLGVHHSDIDRIVEEAMKSGNVPVNPRPTSRDQLAQILKDSL